MATDKNKNFCREFTQIDANKKRNLFFEKDSFGINALASLRVNPCQSVAKHFTFFLIRDHSRLFAAN